MATSQQPDQKSGRPKWLHGKETEITAREILSGNSPHQMLGSSCNVFIRNYKRYMVLEALTLSNQVSSRIPKEIWIVFKTLLCST